MKLKRGIHRTIISVIQAFFTICNSGENIQNSDIIQEKFWNCKGFLFLTCQWLQKMLLTTPLVFFFLSCQNGYVGSRCQFRDPCTTSPCMNGGTCRAVTKENTVDFSCTCKLGFTDRRCLTPVNNVCISSPCHNGGTCELESLQTYKCRCPPGWSGNTQQYYERGWCLRTEKQKDLPLILHSSK